MSHPSISHHDTFLNDNVKKDKNHDTDCDSLNQPSWATPGMPPFARILMVGEGDLSYSLALSRVFGGKSGHCSKNNHQQNIRQDGQNSQTQQQQQRKGIEIIATTLPNRFELEQTYNSVAGNIKELCETWNQTVIHGIDATRLDQHYFEEQLAVGGTDQNGKREKQQQKQSASQSLPLLPRLDAIVFSHPHLGLHDLQDEAAHALKHSILIGHFLYSAKRLFIKQYFHDQNQNKHAQQQHKYKNNTSPSSSSSLNDSTVVLGTIHLTLCGTQPQTWNLHQHAKRHKLKLIRQKEPTSIHAFLPLGCDDSSDGASSNDITTAQTTKQPQPKQQIDDDTIELIRMEANLQASHQKWSARRKFRSGALGSKHWLGKFGYEHRRTAGDQDMKVDKSIEFVYQVILDDDTKKEDSDALAHEDHGGETIKHQNTCPICNYVYQTEDEMSDMEKHVREMALPVVIHHPPSGSTEAAATTTMAGTSTTTTSTNKDSANQWKCNMTGRTFATEYALYSFQKQQKAQPNSLKEKQQKEQQLDGSSNDNKYQEKSTLTTTTTCNQNDQHHQKHVEFKVPSSPSSLNIRAKQYVRKVAFPTILKTKKLAHTAFTENRLLLNGEIIEESRFIKPNDILTLIFPTIPESGIFPSMTSSGNRMNTTTATKDTSLSSSSLYTQKGNFNYGTVSIQWLRQDIAIVWKPCGMRCKGPFDGTLQSALRPILTPMIPKSSLTTQGLVEDNNKLKKQPKEFKDCIPLSRLEIGCSGLCLVARSKVRLDRLEELDKTGRISYTFIALVHGRLSTSNENETWSKGRSFKLPVENTKRMKRNRKRQRSIEEQKVTSATAYEKQNNEIDDDDDSDEKADEERDEDEERLSNKEALPKLIDKNGDMSTSTLPITSNDTITAKLISVTADDSPVHLSTLRITSHDRSGRLFGDICYVLRQINHAVVGDKFARQDQQHASSSASNNSISAGMPRYCSPILKGKVQLRCLGISIVEENIDYQLDIPVRMMASTWSSAETAIAAKNQPT